MSYATEESDWLFDSSFLLNGGGRIPSTQQNPVEYQREESFPAYLTVNAQMTKRIDMVDLYLGLKILLTINRIIR